MKHILSLLTVSCLLAACSSSSVIDTTTTKNFSSGQRAGDSVSFFWLTEKDSVPDVASDAVFSGKDGDYKTSYYWSQGSLQEIIRQGEQLNQQGHLVSFSVQLRFSQSGDAVYQLYRLDGKVFPILQEQIQHYEDQAANIVNMTKGRGSQTSWTRLVQGYWDGETFASCDNQEYSAIEFNQTLPTFVINRLAALDNYLAVLGSVKGDTLYVDELLVLADDSHECLKPADFRGN